MRLAGVACHVPERRIDAEEIIVSAGGRPSDARAFTKLFGIERVAVSDPQQPLADRFATALYGLERSVRPEGVEALIYVHGLPVQYASGKSPIAELLKSHPSLESVRFIYEVDQNNCAGLFWALDLARQLLVADTVSQVVIIAGDSLAELPLSHRYVPGCTLIGDAFVALLVDQEPGQNRIGKIALDYRSEFAFGVDGSETELQGFFRAHDGMVTAALDSVGYAWKGDEKLLPHNVNRLVWLQFCRRLGVDLDRINLSLVADTGHCYTTDPVLLLERFLATPGSKPDAITLLSVGLGAYIGACRVHFLGTD